MNVVIKRPKTTTKERKFNPIALIKLLSMLLCAIIIYSLYSNWQSLLEKLDDKPITAFALIGSSQFTQNTDVRDAITQMGELKGFWGQPVEEVREQIQSTMPWVKNSVVHKIWPDRLTVEVLEYQPIAYWNDDSFLSSDGAIFQLPKEKLKETNLPHLFGPDYQSNLVLNAWNQIFNLFKGKNLTLESVSIDERGSWEVSLTNGILLKLGTGEWKGKLDRFMTIYPQIEVPENKKINYVDLRYKSGAAVSFRDL